MKATAKGGSLGPDALGGASKRDGGRATTSGSAERVGRRGGHREVETKALELSSEGWKCHRCTHDCSRPQDCVHTCVNVGPLDSADMEDVEHLYMQAREAYHSGSPILSDDDFDSIESMLRYERSDLVSKGPRCSLRGLNIYSDASLDKSQTFMLASFWSFLSVVSYSFAARSLPGLLHSEVFDSLNVAVGLGFFSAFTRCLGNVLKGNEVAVKGSCPSCGEEVYTFADFNSVEDEECHIESRCHMCRRPLLFKITKHKGIIRPVKDGEWAYGKIFSQNVAEDYTP
ncbi:PGR5-like protein 1B [Chloropicon roscoffensis]|uniref:PGR5-like protein 1B n=1 Tax=Chloropicon roscoffensis TaxID=1461544 RepID=A0AAX4PD46_9CHLO